MKSEEKQNEFQKLNPQTKKLIIIGGAIFFIVLLVAALSMEGKSKKKIEEEKERLEVIIDEVNTAIIEEDFEKAEVLVLKVDWELNETNTSGYDKDYDKKREVLQELIETKKVQKTEQSE